MRLWWIEIELGMDSSVYNEDLVEKLWEICFVKQGRFNDLQE